MNRQIVEMLSIEFGRIPLFAPVILGLGIIYGVHFPFTEITRLIVFTAAMLLLSPMFKKTIMAAIIIFTTGVFIAQTGGILRTDLISCKKYIEETNKKVSFYANVGVIDESHPMMKDMQRAVFHNVEFKDSKDLEYIKTIKMTCSSKMLRGIEPKDTVKVFGVLTRFREPAIPNSFDQLQYSIINGIDASGIALHIRKSKTQVPSNFLENFSYMRFKLTRHISEKMGGDASGIAAALLTGDKSSIKPEVKNWFIKSGIAHILAISGLHMSIVAGILFMLYRRIFLYISCFCSGLNARGLAASATIPLTFLYLALSGFSPSAVRAFIMTTTCLLGIIFGKKAISLRNISIAAFSILLFDPFSLFYVSFQLSFSAVVVLISFFEVFQEKFFEIRINKSLKYLLISIITTIIATVATTPISVATFNRFSSQNILGNLMAIPVTSFLIAPLGIANIFLGWFTDILIEPLKIAINIMLKAAQSISSLPGSEIALKTPTPLILSIVIMGGIFLCLLRTRLRYMGLIPISISTFMYVFVQKNPYIIFVPGEDNVVCVIENDTLYSNSKQKGRNKINTIMRTVGVTGEIQKLDRNFKIPEIRHDANRGLFIWKNGDMKQLSIRRHPVCPVSFENLSQKSLHMK
jgi:competence protein ComEC